MQSQIVCNGCRATLLYPRGATSVLCALCRIVTSVPSPGMEMSRLYCGGCRTLLMYTRGATSVRCTSCSTVNHVPGTSFQTSNLYVDSSQLVGDDDDDYDDDNDYDDDDDDVGSSLKHKPLEEWQGWSDSLRQSTASYQIFLSFRGEDTGQHFTSTLYTELRKNGFKTFMDNELKSRDQISTKLVKAIEDSRLSIVVLSVNYPNSFWCLDELVHILHCMETKKQLVWPVFYKVEPTQIRYKGVMTKLKERYPHKITKWKKALYEVCSLSGLYYKEGMSQPKFIQKIVDNVKNIFEAECPKNIVNSKSQSQSSGSNLTPDSGAPDRFLMALKEQLKYNSETLVELSKELQNDSINQIALYGKQGSGKTKLVEAVRDKAKTTLSTLFDVVLFSTVSKKDPMSIQDEIARELDLKLGNGNGKYERAKEIEEKLKEKKAILVILDDVPARFDPHEIIGIRSNGQRRKFLLTSCHKKGFLSLKSAEEERKRIRMRPLSAEDALALLQEHSEIEDESDNESSEVLTVAKEISSKHKLMPGEIVEIGSSLKGKLPEEWQGLLDSLRHSTARYNIFLSFRGDDTRGHFTDTLYEELKLKRFKTFMDKQIPGRKEISTELESN